jgi:ABC-type transport system involved in Fe-S cluster assembly fused permease/ATPase subunit
MQRYGSQKEYDASEYMYNLLVRWRIETLFSNADSSHKYIHHTIEHMQRFMISDSNSDLILCISARMLLGAGKVDV